jgi:hypothetical protein
MDVVCWRNCTLQLDPGDPAAERLNTSLVAVEQTLLAGWMTRRVFGGMQLADWMRLSGVTGLTLRCSEDIHYSTLAAVLPRLTTLRSLVLTSWWPKAAGGCCALLPIDLTAISSSDRSLAGVRLSVGSVHRQHVAAARPFRADAPAPSICAALLQHIAGRPEPDAFAPNLLICAA